MLPRLVELQSSHAHHPPRTTQQHQNKRRVVVRRGQQKTDPQDSSLLHHLFIILLSPSSNISFHHTTSWINMINSESSSCSAGFESHMRRAISSNNEGVECLRRGQLKETTLHLSSSLQSAKAALMTTQRVSTVGSQQEDPATVSVSLQTLSVELDMLPSSSASTAASVHAVCTKIFLLQRSDEESSNNRSTPEELCNTLSAIVVFNLALLHHLKGMQASDVTSSTTPNDFEKAVRLYEHSYQLHMNDSTHSSSPDFSLRAMSILNNLAHVHSVLNDETRSGLCWQKLLSLILYCREYGILEAQEQDEDTPGNSMQCEDEDDEFLQRQCPSNQVQRFLSNVTHLILKDEISAPAA